MLSSKHSSLSRSPHLACLFWYIYFLLNDGCIKSVWFQRALFTYLSVLCLRSDPNLICLSTTLNAPRWPRSGRFLPLSKKRKRSAVRKFLRVLRFSARLILITCNGQSDRYRNTGRVGCCRRETPYRRASVIILCPPKPPQKGREGNMSRFPFSAALGMTI